MTEQRKTSGYDTNPGTPFHDGDRIDTHAGNPNLISQEELMRQRQKAAFDQEVLRLMGVTPERRALTVHEQIGIISVNLTQFRRERRQEDYDLAAGE